MLGGSLSCFETAVSHVKKVIVQFDYAKNFGGKQTKQLLPYVYSAAGLKLVAYYHNEAQSGKDVCDTHFSHQQTHVNTYLVQGVGGRKVSTPKQLAVALIENPIMNRTVLLLKPDFISRPLIPLWLSRVSQTSQISMQPSM